MTGLLEKFRVPVLVGLLLSILAAALIVYLRAPKSSGPIEIVLPSASPTPDKEIKVYVSGAVAKPGVYALAVGNRVEDAIRAAGGATTEANLDAINLANRARDEMHVYVPKVGEASVGTGPGAPGQKISISSASIQQLESLPGIGSVTAKNIVDHRSKNGSFTRIEELRDLKLVNAPTFEKIKDLIAP